MDEHLRGLREILIWPLLVLLLGWTVYLMTGRQAIEFDIRIVGMLSIGYPMALPRLAGLLWYILPALWVYWSECRGSFPSEEDLHMSLGFWLILIVIAGILSWVALLAGAWLTIIYALLLGGVTGLIMSFNKEDRISLMPTAFFIGSCVGIWTGFWSGLLHGVIAFAATVAVLVWKAVPKRQVVVP